MTRLRVAEDGPTCPAYQQKEKDDEAET